jgi:tetratricopeptide (TPR) repeat protein
MSADGSGVQKLSRSQEHEYQHVWSPDSQKIVFTRSRNRSVPRDLWMMNADGSHLTLIAAAPAEDEFILPAFAPDGQRLVFTRVAMPAHHWTLWTINLNGSGLSQLTFDPSGTAAWSPDGRKIAFMSRRRTGNAEIYLMNLLPFQAPPLVVAAQPTANEAVLRLCANGRKFWNQRTMESMRKGLTLFEEAVALDPNYAPAWIGIADSWCLLSEYGTGLAHEAYPKAKAAALRALELDERLPEAHTALALIKNYYDWDWAGAEASFRRALELNPNHATTHQWYAEFLAARGRFPEALKQIDRAQELAPDSLIIQSVEAWILYFVRDYDRAIAQCQRVIERAPNFAEIYSYLGRSYEMQGKFREAMDAFQKSSEIMKENTQRASALRTAAIRDAADYWRRRGELEEVTGNGALFETAEALTQQGETDRALTLLEQACEQRSTHVPYLDVFPTLDPLRPHPRFKALLQRAQLATK